MKTAILIDGGFYRRRAQIAVGEKTPAERAKELESYSHRHLTSGHGKKCNQLYRIFYYDCPPMEKKLYHPLLKKQIDFSKTPLYNWMNDFFNELKKRRKFALRLGRLADSQAFFTLRPDVIKKLCTGKLELSELSENDFVLDVRQKGVDMKIGIDIASLAYKKQVDQIVLISGDSDFVPAAKLARREGIDFILDPLGAVVKDDLLEHIDGLRTCDNAYRIKR